MPRTVSATEAKTAFGSLVDWAATTKDDVIVESRGRPKVVIVAFEEYQRLSELRERARREEALARLEALRERTAARSADLSADEVSELADRVTREAIRRLIAEGKVRYGPEA